MWVIYHMKNIHGRASQPDRLPVGDTVEGPDQLADRSSTQHRVASGNASRSLLRMAGPCTPAPPDRRRDVWPVPLENRFDGFLASRLYEGTGVDHHDIGRSRVNRCGVSGVGEHGGQLVRVDLVLGTAQSG